MVIINFLRGKKTYIVGILMVILGFLQEDSELILEGVGFVTLRAGIGKVGK